MVGASRRSSCVWTDRLRPLSLQDHQVFSPPRLLSETVPVGFLLSQLEQMLRSGLAVRPFSSAPPRHSARDGAHRISFEQALLQAAANLIKEGTLIMLTST